MKKLYIPEMHCSKCEARIHEALEKAGIAHTIELDKKTVTVAENDVDKTTSELDDLGFSVKKPGLFARLFGK